MSGEGSNGQAREYDTYLKKGGHILFWYLRWLETISLIVSHKSLAVVERLVYEEIKIIYVYILVTNIEDRNGTNNNSQSTIGIQRKNLCC